MTIETSDIKITEGFRCTPKLLFEAFTNPEYIRSYTRSEAAVDVKVGGKFSLFGGNLEGEFVQVDAPNSYTQKWRFKSWPDNWFSTVKMTFEAESESVVKLTIEHTNIPEKDKYGNHSEPQRVEAGWRQKFVLAIQKFVGYVKVDL